MIYAERPKNDWQFSNPRIDTGAEERPEDLYQRIVAFVEDSLLSGHGILHHGDMVTEDEMSPTLENFVVLTWLRLIHPD